jgi:hypothetical protein
MNRLIDKAHLFTVEQLTTSTRRKPQCACDRVVEHCYVGGSVTRERQVFTGDTHVYHRHGNGTSPLSVDIEHITPVCRSVHSSGSALAAERCIPTDKYRRLASSPAADQL